MRPGSVVLGRDLAVRTALHREHGPRDGLGPAYRASARRGKSLPLREHKPTTQTSCRIDNQLGTWSGRPLHVREVFIHLFFAYAQNPRNILRGVLAFSKHLGNSSANRQSMPPRRDARSTTGSVHKKRESARKTSFTFMGTRSKLQCSLWIEGSYAAACRLQTHSFFR